MTAIGGRQLTQGGQNGSPRLPDLPKRGGAVTLQVGQLLVEGVGESGRDIADVRLFGRKYKGGVELPLESRVRSAFAVIQVAEQALPIDRRVRRGANVTSEVLLGHGRPLHGADNSA